ncbi:hypothetical protein HY312_04100 [Candidatus Saccharibacteria bacterium]|nr:hypothetical protein [Candidatus Saccharibacteria bacterium]
MADLLKKTFELLIGTEDISMPKLRVSKKKSPTSKPTRRQLIQMESEIGGTLFGDVPKGHRREFFNLDPDTWIWHEEWNDHSGKRRTATTRYEIHENGILKAQEGAKYNFIEGDELDNFMLSTRLYYERIAREIYNCDPQTGQPLVQQAAS